MAKKNEKGDWLDPQGNAIPPKYLKALDKRRDAVVTRCINKVRSLEKRMLQVKKELFDEMADYEAYVAEKYDVKSAPGGNLTLTSFSGDVQVQRTIQQNKTFNELLTTAKALIDECLVKWSEGADPKVIAVIEQAFNVNQAGKVNHQAILGLKKLSFKDKEWNRAMEILNEAYVVTTSATYIRVLERDEETGKFNNINLNFSNL